MAEEIIRYTIDPSGAVSGARAVEGAVKGIDQATRTATGNVTSSAAAAQAAGSRWEGFGKQVLASAIGFTAVTAGAQAIRGAFTGTIGAAIAFESSFAGVRKTVDGTDAELAAIAAGFRGMAKEIPVNVNELNAIGEAAGQLGVRKEDILGFTRVMADLGVTTNLTSDEAATSLAQLMNIMQTAGADVDNLGSAVVALGNNGASTERDIVSMGLRIAGAGAIVGLTEAQVLGFASALSSVGINAEAGGSAFSRVMVDIGQAVETSDAKLELFAQTAQMTVPEFSRLFREDAAGAIIAFVEGLGRINAEGGSVFGTLEELELGEIRVRDALLRASGAGDLMRQSLETGNQAWRDNNALTLEAKQRYQTTASQIQVAKNNLADLGITIGNAVVPMVGALAQGGTDLLQVFSGLPDSTQNLILMSAPLIAMSSMLPGLGLKFAAFFTAVQAGSASATLALSTAGVLGALIAIDLLLDRMTGEGLVQRLFPDDGAERAKRVNEELQKLRTTVSDPLWRGDPLKLYKANLEGIRVELQGLYNDGKVSNDQINDLNDKFKANALALMESGASTAELILVWRALGETGTESAREAQRVFDAVTGVTDAVAEQEAAFAASGGEVGQWAYEMQVAAGQAGEVAEVIETEAVPAAQHWSYALRDDAGELLSVEDRIKAVMEAIDQLNARFAASDPVYQALIAQQAVYQEELDDLKAKGDDLNETERARVETLEALIENIDGQTAAMASNQKAVEAAQTTLQRLMGPEGYETFQRALGQTKLSLEEQTDVTGRVSSAYNTLAFGDLPSAISKFGELKAELAPEVWTPIAEALGPALIDAIRTGVDDPAKQAELFAAMHAMMTSAMTEAEKVAFNASEIGRQIVNGIAQGIRDNAYVAVQAAAEAAGATMNEFAGAFQVESPSRWAMEVGRMVMWGLADGLADGTARVIEAATNAVSTVQSATLAELEAMIAALTAKALALPEELAGSTWAAIDRIYAETSARMFPGGEHPSARTDQPFGMTSEEIAAWVAAANAAMFPDLHLTAGGQNPADPVIYGQVGRGTTFNGEPLLEGTYDPSGNGGRGLWWYDNAWHIDPPSSGIRSEHGGYVGVGEMSADLQILAGLASTGNPEAIAALYAALNLPMPETSTQALGQSILTGADRATLSAPQTGPLLAATATGMGSMPWGGPPGAAAGVTNNVHPGAIVVEVVVPSGSDGRYEGENFGRGLLDALRGMGL